MRTPVIVGVATVAVLVGAVVISGYRAPATPPRLTDHDVRISRIAVIADSYTTGGPEGGLGANGWTTRAGQELLRDGNPVTASVAAEGGAGYGVRGNHGNLFVDLVPRAVTVDDALVVFFGSRNDDVADPGLLAGTMHDALARARDLAPTATLLVIGPPWPTADVPAAIWRVRDTLAAQTWLVGGDFVDPLAEGWFVGRPDLIGADGIHPNDAGHAYLATRIAPLISARLAG